MYNYYNYSILRKEENPTKSSYKEFLVIKVEKAGSRDFFSSHL